MLLSLLVAALPTAPIAHPSGSSIEWHDRSFKAALAQAQDEERMVLVYFWRSESDYCVKLYGETLQNEQAVEKLSPMVCYSASFDNEAGAKLAHEYGVQTLPTMLFLDSKGNREDAIAGFISAHDLAYEVDRIGRGEGTLSDLQKKADAFGERVDDEALEARWVLAGKLQDLGDKHGHDAVLAGIRESDPHATTKIGSRCHLWHIADEVAEAGGGDEHIEEWDLAPLHTFAKRVKNPEGRFEAWERIGNLEAGRSNVADACDAFAMAWKVVPDERAPDWGSGVAGWVMRADGERTKDELRFALKLAKESVKLVEAMDPESDACRERCGDMGYEGYLAERLNTLAMAYSKNGKQKNAIKLARRVVELVPDNEEYRAILTELEERG